MSKISAFLREDGGASMVEYAVLLGLITAVSAAAISTAGGYINTIWTNTDNYLQTAAG
jgi:Flp pilus assembly pilin Flp